MKIIISPSKTQSFDESKVNKVLTTPLLKKQSDELRNILCGYTKEELGHILKIKSKLLDQVYEAYHSNDEKKGAAIEVYTGAVFQQLQVDSYRGMAYDYLKDHLFILSALYGILKPFDWIEPYRLDMGHRILNETLYEFWKNELDKVLKDEEVIINLASNEFSRLIKQPMVTINFKELRDGQYKLIGTYAKIARGKILHYMISENIKELEDIKGFQGEGYKFNKELSTDQEFIFTR
ncbi:YaaA family protein [Vallitalea okinawensis]|uniref:YaaA family protein n=1 Tax=Vallitalea okinawensis TaxID=2078660 RepID=UPI000CFE2981|nr:YaaA family protein [Vallitalea okinawensis]